MAVETFYLIMVGLLFLLAVTDLVVGVSNDAVNFLNNAVGSKVAPLRTIMIVAALGILIGASTSSGMMEVARKGVFNPQYFYFSEIMILFLAVMLTDIILLDFFNTLGMPTSTTVSIVFELLGASVILAVIKVNQSGAGLEGISQYINSSSALAIISGIFLSVGIAFVVGALVMYFTRLLFSFNYERHMKWTGPVWGGLALSAMSYFLLFKALRGASFMPGEFMVFVQEQTLLLLLIAFGMWTVILFLVNRWSQYHILRIVVLFGTFALAMAFAGNDLVNFIGVPIAGFESYNDWRASGANPDTYTMERLSQAYPTQPLLLVLAGIIMALTLWFSKKARSVTETEVNLGRQAEGLERFAPNDLSRGLVRFFWKSGQGLGRILPARWAAAVEKRFEPVNSVPDNGRNEEPPAFDLVRASANLTMASILIAIATSYKLPLSTTYVSFMVAMGTSLADRAWGRDSAVFRVAGVVSVIGGWFATAFIAFTVAGSFAFLIHRFGGVAIVILFAMAVFFIARSFIYHRKKEKEKTRIAKLRNEKTLIPSEQFGQRLARQLEEDLAAIQQSVHLAILGLLKEDRKTIRRAKKMMKKVDKRNDEFKYTFYGDMKRIEESRAEGSRIYLFIWDLKQDIIQSANTVIRSCYEHVANVLRPLGESQHDRLTAYMEQVEIYFESVRRVLPSPQEEALERVRQMKQQLHIDMEEQLASQVLGVKEDAYSAQNSMLYFRLLLEVKDLVAVAARFVKIYERFYSDAEILVVEEEFPGKKV